MDDLLGGSYYSHFKDREPKTLRSEAICPGSRGQLWWTQHSNPGVLGPRLILPPETDMATSCVAVGKLLPLSDLVFMNEKPGV